MGMNLTSVSPTPAYFLPKRPFFAVDILAISSPSLLNSSCNSSRCPMAPTVIGDITVYFPISTSRFIYLEGFLLVACASPDSYRAFFVSEICMFSEPSARAMGRFLHVAYCSIMPYVHNGSGNYLPAWAISSPYLILITYG